MTSNEETGKKSQR